MFFAVQFNLCWNKL